LDEFGARVMGIMVSGNTTVPLDGRTGRVAMVRS